MEAIRNLQNIPREKRIRRLYLPHEPGQILIEADLSQAEGMYVAWKAKETRLMKLYKEGKDVHSHVGSIVMQKPVSKDTPIERQASKTIVHASNYGTSPKKITEILLKDADIVMDIKEANIKQNIYYQNFNKIIMGFQRGIQRELADNNRVLLSESGFIRKFYSPWGQDLFRQAYAHRPQNVVAYITNQGLNFLYYKTKYKDNLYTQTHDSICISVDEKDQEDGIEMLKMAMTREIIVEREPLTIPVDIKVGPNLGEMEEI